MNRSYLAVVLATLACVPKSIAHLRGETAQQEKRQTRGEAKKKGEDPDDGLCASVVALAKTPGFEQNEGATGSLVEEKHEPEEEFACQLSNGLLVPLLGTDDQLNELRFMLNNGTFVSSEDTIEVHAPEASFIGDLDGELAFTEGINDNTTTLFDVGVHLPPGAVVVKTGNRRNRRRASQSYPLQGQHHDTNRHLAIYAGDKPVLAVKVYDSQNRAVKESAAVISNKIFGTYGDRETMTSQFAACSFGKLQITNEVDKKITDKLSAPGVLEVKIPITLKQKQSKIIAAADQQIKKALGLSKLPGPFQHVMYILQDCYDGCGWAAYAFINYWSSVYRREYYMFPAIQMHEIGHNLNLAHSGGLDGKEYTDHTCLMGNPLYHDNIGEMCFNPAKNFQITKAGGNWYGDSSSHIQLFNPGKENYKEWSGIIVGIADYDRNPDDHPVVLKIEHGTANDYFIGFNRAAGPNKDNDEADDMVTIVRAGSEGKGYSKSFLQATLSEGKSHTIPKWRDTKFPLIIKVNKINISSIPAYADVTVTFFGPGGTKSPTPNPTPKPTSKPISSSPTSSPTGSPTDSPTDSPTNSPTSLPTELPTEPPTTKPTIAPAVGGSPPATPSPTQQPTPNPTKSPSLQPSKNPTSLPTRSPSNSPTKSPMASPKNPVCGDGICHVSESPGKCSQDCLENSLTTPFDKGEKSDGYMFAVKSRQDVTVTSISFAAKKKGNSDIMVYTRSGNYRGHEDKPGDWELVLSTNKKLENKKYADLGNLDKEVSIPNGSIQSFYVWSEKSILFKEGSSEGRESARDNSLIVYEGIGIKDDFGKEDGGGEWTGVVSYYTSTSSVNIEEAAP